MKKILLSVFIIINLLTPLSFVKAEASISIFNQTPTDVTLLITGVETGVDVSITVKSTDNKTPIFNQIYNITRSENINNGTLIKNIPNLSPSRSYNVTVAAATIAQPNTKTQVGMFNFVSLPDSNSGTNTPITQCVTGQKESWRYQITEHGASYYSFIFNCQQDCQVNRDQMLSEILRDPSSEKNVGSCEQLIDIVNVTGKKTGDKYDPIYHLLAPIGSLTEIKTDDVGKYFNIIFKIAIGLCGALAVVMFVIGGVTYMGNESIFDKNEGKKMMTGAILGLIIALGSYALLNTINPDLLGGKGVTIEKVTIDLEQETEPDNTYSSSGDTSLCTAGFVDVQTTKGSINICKTMATNLKNMIDKAASENPSIILFGYGTRSEANQVQKRQQNCPDPVNSPASDCKPPTARPGHSKHQAGLAVDFRCGNQSMMESGGTSSPCFKWLSTNAATYGFYNLVSEPWHWSDDGR